MTVRSLIPFLIFFSCSIDKNQNVDAENLNSSDTVTNEEIAKQEETRGQVDSIKITGPGPLGELIGVWQDSPEIASGYTDHYEFYNNGDFAFNYNEMVCDNRTISYSGTWALIGNDSLKLTITNKTIIVGGKLVSTDGAGSCASDYYIEGGEMKVINLDDFQDIVLSSISIDEDKRDLKTRTFDRRPFWKIKEHPTASY